MPISLRQMKYFVAIAEELNIGRAAKRLHLSQPPLTRHMHQLEATIGAPLFTRTRLGVELTGAALATVGLTHAPTHPETAVLYLAEAVD